MSGGISGDQMFLRFKERGYFTFITRGNVEVLGTNKAENELVTCDGHLKRDI